ncbi:MAG TPA: hypothetical protein DCY93_03580 [Firmicutes bacterium]|nr:hypothetical protein [Bacillota bacterium]
MKLLKETFGKANRILFLDIEGTQIQHEVIEIGAVLVGINGKHQIDDSVEQVVFREFCVAHEPIGKIVTEMTGLTEETLSKKGKTFEDAMRELNKIIGSLGDNLIVATFGNQDEKMLTNSLKFYEENQFVKSFVSYLTNRIWDFSSFINNYIKNDHNQALSLLKLLDKFGLKEYGKAHDPVNDAMNLCNIYGKMVTSSDILAEEYLKVLHHNHGQLINSPVVRKYMDRLVCGENIKFKDFSEELKKYFE